jgi:hypothetical protein
MPTDWAWPAFFKLVDVGARTITWFMVDSFMVD